MDKKDMTFAGSGMLSGGDYGRVYFAGSGKVMEDVTCDTMTGHGALRSEGDLYCREKLECAGSFYGLGNVSAPVIDVSGGCHLGGRAVFQKLTTAGSLKIDGDAEGGDMNCAGSVALGGSLLSGSLRTAGSAKVGGSIRGDGVDVSGGLEVGEDCEVEHFQAGGRVEIGGLLNAEKVEIELSRRDSHIGEIGGGEITVRRGGDLYHTLRNNETIGDAVGDLASAVKNLLGDLGLGSVAERAKDAVTCGTLYVSQIEGETLFLENVEAQSVRGCHVTVGEGCRIGRIEYTERLEVLPGAQVGESVKNGEEPEEE